MRDVSDKIRNGKCGTTMIGQVVNPGLKSGFKKDPGLSSHLSPFSLPPSASLLVP